MVGYKPLQKWFVSVPQHIPKKIARQDFSGKGEITKRPCKLANCRLAKSEVYLDAVGYNTLPKRTKYFFVKRSNRKKTLIKKIQLNIRSEVKVTERLTPRLTIALVPPCGNNKEDFVIELIKNGTLRDLANCKTVCWYAQAMTETS